MNQDVAILGNMNNTINGLVKEEAIRTAVATAIKGKHWRDAAVKDALAFLVGDERKLRRSDVAAFVKQEFDAAGAGWNGRWS